MLSAIEAEGGLGDTTYKRLYQTVAGPPLFCGLPKIHIKGIPPKSHSHWKKCSHKGGGKGAGQHHQAIGRAFPTPY